MVLPALSTRNALDFLPALAALPLLLSGCEGDAAKTGGAKPWFPEVGAELGLTFVHSSGAKGRHAMPEIMGGGVALFDAESDGDLDIYCINGNGRLLADEPDPSGSNGFFRQDSTGHFSEATREAGLVDGRYGMGVAVGDVDNDGDRDLYVTHHGPNTLFRNDGAGHFEEDDAGCSGEGWSCSAAFFDLDRNGFLDLYVTRYVSYRAKECFDNAGRPDYCGPLTLPAQHDLLFRNSNGVFRDATREAGIDATVAAGLGVVCADFDGDGWQDVYVANDAYANSLWINKRNGTLRDEALQRGIALNLSGQPQAGMGVGMGDFDGDAELDVFVTHLREETNALYLGRGARGFVDATGASLLGPASMPYTGFGVAAVDLDLDADLDLVVANGAVFHRPRVEGVELPSPWADYAEPNLVHLNQGDGTFTEAAPQVGPLALMPEISRGLAAGDVDGDGDTDFLLGNIEGPARLYRNDMPTTGRHWIALRCVHPEWKRDALGAQVEVLACGRRLVGVLSSSSSYCSSSPAVLTFGLSDCALIEGIDVLWPDGTRERFPGPALDRTHVLEWGKGEK